jgi:hypothetical protein
MIVRAVTGNLAYTPLIAVALLPRRRISAYRRRTPMKIRRFTFAVVCALVVGLALSFFAQEAKATTTATGTLVFTFTVTIDSAIPKDGVLVCTASASVESYTQKAIGIVSTPVAGKNTCTVNMPYSWVLATESTDKISLSYSAEVDYGYEVTAENGTGTLVQLAYSDKVAGSVTSISVPTKTPTDIAVSATI